MDITFQIDFKQSALVIFAAAAGVAGNMVAGAWLEGRNDPWAILALCVLVLLTLFISCIETEKDKNARLYDELRDKTARAQLDEMRKKLKESEDAFDRGETQGFAARSSRSTFNYQILVGPHAQVDLNLIKQHHPSQFRGIVDRLDELARDYPIRNAIGVNALDSQTLVTRTPGSYRVLFRVNEDRKEILLLAVFKKGEIKDWLDRSPG